MIYFIQAGDGPMKVGYSRNPQVRLANLQTSHYESLQLVATVAGGLSLEAALHKRFESQQLTGEWYKLSKNDVVMAIQAILLNEIEPIQVEADDEPDDLLTQYDQARELIIELLQEFDEWIPAVDLEEAIITAGPCRRIVKQVRATLRREGIIQTRRNGGQNGQVEWRIT